jgi:molybdopterin converting factor small subunit
MICNYSTNGTSIRREDRKPVINVEVRLYATLRKYYPKSNKSESLKVSLKKGVTLQHIYDRLNISIEDVKIVMVNGRAQNHGYALSDGDRIAIFPPVAGG